MTYRSCYSSGHMICTVRVRWVAKYCAWLVGGQVYYYTVYFVTMAWGSGGVRVHSIAGVYNL